MKRFLSAFMLGASVMSGLVGCAATTGASSTTVTDTLTQAQAACDEVTPTLNAFYDAIDTFKPATQSAIEDVYQVANGACSALTAANAGANLQTITGTVLPQIAVFIAEKAGA